MIRLSSYEQEAIIPPDWSPFALVHFGNRTSDEYRAYIIQPPGLVIDYQKGKIYAVCGNCRVLLRLRRTDSGILIHTKTEGTGHGFVDLDKVESLKQTYAEYRGASKVIDFMLDFEVAIKIWGQSI